MNAFPAGVISSLDPQAVNYVLIPLLIFLARICDVSIGTIRIISVSRGMKLMAAVLGFFEVMIWLFAIGQIIHSLTNIYTYLAFAGGYAAGNYMGILIEEKISMGVLIMRIITRTEAKPLADALRSAGFGVTRLSGSGAHGPVNMIFTVIKRKDFKKVSDIVKNLHPNAFYTAEEVKSIHSPPFPVPRSGQSRPWTRFLPGWRRMSRMAP
jgi:uncharacterized protein YebE (UPF0316 family)